MVLTTRGETHFRKQGLTPEMGNTSMEYRRIQIYFSYSYVSLFFFFFLVHIVCSIGLSTLNCFSFTIVLNAKYTALHTKHRPNVSIRLSISTQNHEKHHYFNNSIIIIPSNFFNQCQHSKDVIQRNAIRKVLGINVRCHLSLTLHCETENFWSTIKKFDLYYRSSREIFHRIGKLFPIQTCSISYFIGKQRSLGYSGK